MPLQHIYRPESLDFFYGNKALKKSLAKALSRDEEVPQAYFLKGNSGCGKTTLAEIISITLGVKLNDFGYQYYDAATTRGIETIRKIREKLTYGGKSVFVLDEFHQVTGAASEGLLVALENPPPDKYFILCTSEPGKIKTVIKRRCFNGEVKPLNATEMVELLQDVLAAEEIELDDRIFYAIQKNSQGSPGVALDILDTIIDIHDDVTSSLEMVEAWSEYTYASLELCRAVKDGKWREAQLNLKNNKTDSIILKRNILGFLRKVLLGSTNHMECQLMANKMLPFTEMRIEDGNGGLALAVFLACNASMDGDIPF